MILVDSAVWIDHVRLAEPQLDQLLVTEKVIMHPFVIGEVALGRFKTRARVLASLKELPTIRCADDIEVWHIIEQHQLAASGIGYIDAHLLAATLLTPGTRIWTRDKRLRQTATHLRLAANGLV